MLTQRKENKDVVSVCGSKSSCQKRSAHTHSAWVISAVVILVMALCVLSGCSNNESEDIAEAMTETVAEETAEPTEAPESTEIPESTEEAVDLTEEEVVEPSKPIAADIDNLVTDALNETVGNMSFVIPQINIDSSDVKNINYEIWDALYTGVVEGLVGSNSAGGQYISYEWYVNNNILSLVIECNPYDIDLLYFYVYNVDITGGNELTKDELISSYGMSDSDYLESVRKALYSYSYDTYEFFCEYNGVAMVNEQLSKTISDDNINFARPFINGDGQMCVVADIYSMAGAESYYYIVNITDYEMNANYPSLFSETQDTPMAE
ncbi:MAG: hypothetical protein LUE15_02450 [Oscillospiraceae bacterium]|nr:hypothetical protein [Oscillospiraceae bacterium]